MVHVHLADRAICWDLIIRYGMFEIPLIEGLANILNEGIPLTVEYLILNDCSQMCIYTL